jgi:flagellar biosynthetic protein FliQ
VNSDQVIELTKSLLVISAKLAMPFLLVVLILGLVIGLLQSLTQLQEQTLTFVPKLVACALVIALAGNWMLVEIVSFATTLLENAPSFIGR